MTLIDRIPDKYAERAFMGRNEESKANVINIIAETINSRKILNPIDDVAKRRVNGETISLIQHLAKPGEWQANNVEILIETSKDPNKTVNREVAEERIDTLAKATYIAMKYGENKEATDALQGGSVQKMMEILPEAMKNREFVERVRDLEITNPKIQEILNILDRKGRVFKVAGEGGKKGLRKNLEEAIENLACLEGLNEKGDEEMMRVSAYLGSEVEKMDEAGVKRKGETKTDSQTNEISGTNSDKMVEYLRRNSEFAQASAEYAREHHILEGQIREVSLDELLDSYMKIKAPRERAPQMWEYEVPEFMNGMSREKWRKLLTFNDAWLGAIYNKRNDAAYNNSLEKMKDGILSMKSLEEGELKMWYEDETLKLKEVMHFISRELLTPKQISSKIPEVDNNTGSVVLKDVTRTIYVFDTEVDPKNNKERYKKGSKVEEYVDNEDVYKMGLAKRLVENKIVENMGIAKLAIAMSMDVMEMGGVFSLADGMRKLSWEADTVRLAQRPERKFSLKVGSGELFAGPWTELANILSQGDPQKAIELVKSWGVVPELLSGSFLDQRLYLANGKKAEKTLIEMIYKNEKIPFRDLGNDLLFGWRKDHIQPAARTWMYISNKTPLEFSKIREFDNIISQWRTDFYNDFNQIKKNEDSLISVPVVAGVIGGSIGLWPFSGPYLRIGGMRDPERNRNYVTYAEEIFRAMGLNETEKNELRNFFGVGRKFINDFNDKINDLKVAQNMYASQKLKENMWSSKHLFKPRR